jgi:fructose-bisphosphate aldolase class I
VALLTAGKGNLAAEERSPTLAKRFAHLSLAPAEASPRSDRERRFTTPGWNESIGGAIRFGETVRQTLEIGVRGVRHVLQNRSGKRRALVGA